MRPTKTGMHDESVTLDFMDWAFPLWTVLVDGRSPSEPLFNFTLGQLSASFAEAVDVCRVTALRPCLYSLRHGGASEDFLRRRRTLEEVKGRGRWRTEKSVRRYTKEAKLISELHWIDPKIIVHGEFIEARIQALFLYPDTVEPLEKL